MELIEKRANGHDARAVELLPELEEILVPGDQHINVERLCMRHEVVIITIANHRGIGARNRWRLQASMFERRHKAIKGRLRNMIPQIWLPRDGFSQLNERAIQNDKVQVSSHGEAQNIHDSE